MGLLQRLEALRRRKNCDFGDERTVLLVTAIGPDGDIDGLYNDIVWNMDAPRILVVYTKELYASETVTGLCERFGLEAPVCKLQVPYIAGHRHNFIVEAERQLVGYAGFDLVIVCEDFQAAPSLANFLDCRIQQTPSPRPGDVYRLQVESELCELVGSRLIAA